MEIGTYNMVFPLLGLDPMPAGTSLGRFHVSSHHWKSRLCHSKDKALLHQLNRTLRPWMIASHQLLQQSSQEIPASLWQLQGHCNDGPDSRLKVSEWSSPTGSSVLSFPSRVSGRKMEAELLRERWVRSRESGFRAWDLKAGLEFNYGLKV